MLDASISLGDPGVLAAVTFALLLAGVAKAVTGMGAPLIATPLLVLMLGDLQLAIVIVAVGTVFSNLPFLIGYWHLRASIVRVWPFLVAGLVGIVIGANILVRVDGTLLSGVLGCVIVTFLVVNAVGAKAIADRLVSGRGSGVLMGGIGGALQGSSGASGPLVVMYLLAIDIDRPTFLFLINAIFFGLDVTLLGALLQHGLYTSTTTPIALYAFLPFAVGMVGGFKAARRVDDEQFRKVILALLGVSAVSLFLRAAGVL